MSEQKKSPKDNPISRRKFIRDTSLAAAGFSIVPRHVLGGIGYTAPSDKLVIAGVGAGGKGASDLRYFAETGKVEIAFLCDVDDRQAAKSLKQFPGAKYYHDWREMFDKEHKNFDAVSVSIPDHNHAIVGFNAMQRGKHVYVQKPLTHDIWEARMMGKAAKRYKVVTQMGDQGTSGDGVRQLREWYEAGIIGEVHTVQCWTDRPVWPQGIAWPKKNPPVPEGLHWDLWLGTAQKHNYEDLVVPFNWRGWWDFGTGAIGDMACHIVGPVFKVLQLQYPTEVSCSVSTPYVNNWQQAYHPESGPISSYSQLKFKGENGQDVNLTWMDGGIQPARPDELKPNEIMGGKGDSGNGVIFIGTEGKMMCGVYGEDPQLLPTLRTDEVNVPQKYSRVPGGSDGHYEQWVDACIAGYGNMEVDSPFNGYAVPLTESILMANLAMRSYNIKMPKKEGEEGYGFPGRGITQQWDAENMEVTNFEPANRFVKRSYSDGWPELTF